MSTVDATTGFRILKNTNRNNIDVESQCILLEQPARIVPVAIRDIGALDKPPTVRWVPFPWTYFVVYYQEFRSTAVDRNYGYNDYSYNQATVQRIAINQNPLHEKEIEEPFIQLGIAPPLPMNGVHGYLCGVSSWNQPPAPLMSVLANMLVAFEQTTYKTFGCPIRIGFHPYADMIDPEFAARCRAAHQQYSAVSKKRGRSIARYMLIEEFYPPFADYLAFLHKWSSLKIDDILQLATAIRWTTTRDCFYPSESIAALERVHFPFTNPA